MAWSSALEMAGAGELMQKILSCSEQLSICCAQHCKSTSGRRDRLLSVA